MGTIYSLQYLRAFAAIMVLMYHARYVVGSPIIEASFRNGAAGVDVFFVISGVVIALTVGELSPKAFMAKRIVRIVPLYWLFSLAKLAMLLALGVGTRNLELTPGFVAATFLFLPAYDGDGLIAPLILAGWTLNLEMYFYVVCAVSLAFSRSRFARLATLALVAAAAVGTLFASMQLDDLPAAWIYLWPICIEFVVGLWLGQFFKQGRMPASIALGALLITSAVAALLLLVPYVADSVLLRPVVWGVPAVALVAGALMIESARRVPNWRLPTLAGDSSYALYLSHTAVVPVLVAVISKVLPSGAVQFVSLVAISIVASMVIHVVIEKPLTRRALDLATRLNLVPPRNRKIAGVVNA